MLVFGPYSAIPIGEGFTIFNFSSMNESIPRLQDLFVFGNFPYIINDYSQERDFDIWYYNYVFNNKIPFMSLMQIMNALYETNKVYVCITDYDESNLMVNTVNESLMKLIQARYDIKYGIINTIDDYEYIDKDGCDFMSVYGIQNFDEDRKRYMEIVEEDRIRYDLQVKGGVQ